ncbi:hypothetical protein EMCG_00897, partial [[Emmonsia] crescens]
MTDACWNDRAHVWLRIDSWSSMGGAFTDNPKLTWRWCFYINLPLGLQTALTIIFARKEKKIPFVEQLKQVDLPGTAVILPSIICLVLALQWGSTKYEWKSARIISLPVVAVVPLSTFDIIQTISGDRATVP